MQVAYHKAWWSQTWTYSFVEKIANPMKMKPFKATWGRETAGIQPELVTQVTKMLSEGKNSEQCLQIR
jgi:hypothetical protein